MVSCTPCSISRACQATGILFTLLRSVRPGFPSSGLDAHACTSAATTLPAASSARGVVVLGMGRSGTSSVTRMFHRSGYFVGAPADLMGPTDANPTGHFENWRVCRANEEVLKRLDGSWFDAPDDREQLQAACELRGGLRDVLDELLRAAGSRPLVLKDPRIGVLMPLWRPLIEGILHPVLVLRDPVEIARSLERRDQTPRPVALAMWELNLTRTLAHLDDQAVTIVRYREIVQDPQLAPHIVREASAQLLSPMARVVRPELAASALVPDLYRNRAEALAGTRWLTEFQRRLWCHLESLPAASACLRSPTWTTEASRESRRLARSERHRQEPHQEMWARHTMSEIAPREAACQARERASCAQRRELEEASSLATGLEAK